MVLPQRTSLVSRVTEFLRQQLQAGEWKLRLPGEHQLCEELQVSHPTLRKALALLGEEGWIRAERGLGWHGFVNEPTAIHCAESPLPLCPLWERVG